MGDYVGTDLTPQFAIENSPPAVQPLLRSVIVADARPAGITAAEEADLNAWRNQLANENYEARRLQAHGGVAGIAQKNRTEASWLHANIHAQGNQQ